MRFVEGMTAASDMGGWRLGTGGWRSHRPASRLLALAVLGLVLGLVVTISRLGWGNDITTATVVLVALLLVSGTQFTLFAMWFDQEANKDLR